MKQKLIKITPSNLDVIIDMRYASNNNFTCKKIYENDSCYLIEEALSVLS